MEHSVLSEPNTRATARPGICSPEPHRLQRGYTYPCILLGKIYIFVWIWWAWPVPAKQPRPQGNIRQKTFFPPHHATKEYPDASIRTDR